jgi:hypothetical protein
MRVSSTGNCSSSQRHETAGKLNVPDASSIVPNPNQHHSTLRSNQNNGRFSTICICVQVKTADPATVVDFRIIECRAELG